MISTIIKVMTWKRAIGGHKSICMHYALGINEIGVFMCIIPLISSIR